MSKYFMYCNFVVNTLDHGNLIKAFSMHEKNEMKTLFQFYVHEFQFYVFFKNYSQRPENL